jgi:hypothetical protein
LRALLLLAIGASFVVAAVPARAGCPLTDPACVTAPVGQVTEPVTGVTDPVVGTIGGVVDEVQDTVDPIVDEVPPPLPDPPIHLTDPISAGDSGVSAGDSGVDPDTGTGPGAPPDGSGNARPDRGSRNVVERPVPVQALVGGTFVSGLDPSPSSDVRIGPSPPTDRTGVSLQDVVKGFAFPLALVLIVGAFLLAQDRLDRRDPRLALAPVGPDVLSFT